MPVQKSTSAAASQLGKLGGAARSKSLSKKRKAQIASSGGKAAQGNITPEERKRRAKLGWERRKQSANKD